MNAAFQTALPEHLALAASPQLAENSRLGFRPVASTSRWGFSFSISSHTLGLSGSLYDGRVRSRSTGKERDAESGNDYFMARYYSSAMGRFMSPDWSVKEEPVPYAKMDDPQTLNLYSYMDDNPLGGVDEDGHLPDWMTKTIQSGKKWVDDHPRTMQTVKGVTKIAIGVGLVATIAGGDVPGSVVGVGLVVSGTIGAVSSVVSGVTDLAGASGLATKTEVENAQKGLDGVSNVPALVTSAASGGNVQLGADVGTVADAAQLAAKPQEALKNAATMADAVRTGAGVADLVNKSTSTPPPPPAPKPPAPPSCSTNGTCK